MRIKPLIVLVCGLLVAIVLPYKANAQTGAQLVKAGDKKFSEADYYAASLYYKDALKQNGPSAELSYKYAEASRMFNDYQAAANAYAEVVKEDKANAFPFALFWLGEMLKSSGKYPEAARQFQKFTTKYKTRDYYYHKANQQIQSCAWAKDNMAKTSSAKIEHLDRTVNTEASEFNAMHVYPDRVQFSSLRNVSADKKEQKYLVRIYNQQPNPDPVFTPEGANLQLNIGNGAYSPDTRRFYFTQCEQLDKTTSRCDIYVSRYENFKWTAAEKLSDKVNNAKATNTHPAIGYDSKGGEVLFFASDRAGGEGNMDIWMSRLNSDGTYEVAVNAGGRVNTPGNEVTPFYDINESKLFFSSDWHYGFGGYDIFETKESATTWSTPLNLLPPVNTPQNDLYYSLASDNSKAYITSNRKGSYFIEAETCCNDIYAYATGKKFEKKIDTPVVAPTDTIVFATIYDTIDLKENTLVQPQLIQVKLKTMREHLPVLYFHNDEPGSRSLSDTTHLDYKQTYEAYAMRNSEYRREYAKGLKADARVQKEKELDELFAKVDKGFYDLVAFTSQLYELLQGGSKMEVTVKGYCSPLNYNEYNIKLGYRRVASLRNYFYHYREGILLPYIAGGSLKLINQSFGEETSSKEVSDSLGDIRNSVYSPAAALERRVEIISIELK